MELKADKVPRRYNFPLQIVTQMGATMQTVLTITANQLVAKHPLIRQQRKFSGETLAQTLVFGSELPDSLPGVGGRGRM